MSGHLPAGLPVARVADIQPQPAEEAWLIRSFWARAGVGMIGGSPKSCKSWLGLDMALSVASGTPCLDRFTVDAPGPAVVYLAEDEAPAVRSRLDALCRHRNLDLTHLDLFAITSPVLRLDLARDQQALQRTMQRYRPRLLLLDPLVRLHRLDENSAAEVSGLLGYLRELQRSFDCAVVLVHHASKKQRAQPGQALRGSSDLHAFGDSNAYLARHKNQLMLTLEHRAAKPPDPIVVALVTAEDGTVHLAVQQAIPDLPGVDLGDRVLAFLRQAERAQTRTAIRSALCVNNQRLGDALEILREQGLVQRRADGWYLPPTSPP